MTTLNSHSTRQRSRMNSPGLEAIVARSFGGSPNLDRANTADRLGIGVLPDPVRRAR